MRAALQAELKAQMKEEWKWSGRGEHTSQVTFSLICYYFVIIVIEVKFFFAFFFPTSYVK